MSRHSIEIQEANSITNRQALIKMILKISKLIVIKILEGIGKNKEINFLKPEISLKPFSATPEQL